MSIRNLSHLFRPTSIAVIGASNRARSLGATVMRNLLADGFGGPIMPVNPKHAAVASVLAYPDVESLPQTPDLAVICTAAPTVPGLIAALGTRGTKAAVVLTAGLDRATDADGRSLQQAMLDAARPHLMRLLGPNCVGLVVPGIGLNASFAHTTCLPGKLAFVTQSGALATAVIDRAKSTGIGFSHFVSLGNGADVDFGDVLDYLASDPDTRAILLYIEAVTQARKFMSAARAASRNKPVIVVKAGRMAEGARAAASHTGALAGADDVYDAAIRRAGMLRVDTIDDLFDAVETLGRAKPLAGERLVIMTNGGGAGVMATDALLAEDGRLAALSDETLARLDGVLPPLWSRANPVDIIGDAPPERYRQTLEVLLTDKGNDAVLFLHAPTAIVPSAEIAEAVAPLIRDARRLVLTSWLGGDAVAEARRLAGAAGAPTYETPEQAVAAFLHIVNYRRNQEMLLETPAAVPEGFARDRETAVRVIDGVFADGRDMLSKAEAKQVLAAYDIPTVETRIASTPQTAAREAAALGFPVAVKILSPDVSHKSDVGGVVLDLGSPDAVEAAAEAMAARLAGFDAKARLDGFTVQRMMRRPGAHELIVGAHEDPVFGPVVLFGTGGTGVEVIGDRSIGLPPLNMSLARQLVSRTRISRLLQGFRKERPADLDAIYMTLMQVSQLVTDIPEIAELDINPLVADAHGVLALDARIRIARSPNGGANRLAIRPCPDELRETVEIDGGKVEIRPIRPEDEPQHRALFQRLSPEDIRLRFFGRIREPVHTEMARYTQIDYDREMAFIASRRDAAGAPETLGVVRVIADPDNIECEFAIVVRSDLKGRGLGRLLMDKVIDYARAKGTRKMVADVLSENLGMLALARRVGFRIVSREEGVVRIERDLAAAQDATAD